VKLTPGSSIPRKGPNRADDAEVRPSKRNRTARISLHLYQNLQRAETKTKPVRHTLGAPRPVLPRCPAIRSIRSPPPVKRYLGSSEPSRKHKKTEGSVFLSGLRCPRPARHGSGRRRGARRPGVRGTRDGSKAGRRRRTARGG